MRKLPHLVMLMTVKRIDNLFNSHQPGASSVPSEDGCKKSLAPQGGHQNHPLHYKKCIISINFSSFALSIWLFLTLVTFKNSATLLRTGACTHCLKSTGANAPAAPVLPPPLSRIIFGLAHPHWRSFLCPCLAFSSGHSLKKCLRHLWNASKRIIFWQ